MSKLFKAVETTGPKSSPFGEWKLATSAEDAFIEGRPGMFYREKPSDNGNGWWAGGKLVYEFSTREQESEILKAARRRLEDRIRKDDSALMRAIKAVFN